MEQKYILSLLIKIGAEENIDRLQQKGLIFSKTIKYFRDNEIEQFKLRKDEREGAQKSLRINDLSTSIRGKELPLIFLKPRLNIFDPNLDLCHIYCLYMASPKLADGEPFIDNRNIAFGDFSLIITDPFAFIQRIEDSIRDKYSLMYNPVTYYSDNEDYNNLTVFDKPEYFSYQREFRLFFDYKNANDLQFEIGSIEDISLKIESKQLTSLTLKRI